MGGPGSGRQYRWERAKTNVEESLAVAMRDFRGRVHPHSAGTLTRSWSSGRTASISYIFYRERRRVDGNARLPLARFRRRAGSRPTGFDADAIRRPALVVHLPASREERPVQQASRQTLPAARGALLWLSQVPRPDLPKLPTGAPSRARDRVACGTGPTSGCHAKTDSSRINIPDARPGCKPVG